MIVETAIEPPNEIEAIIGGYHGDAFRILGPHALTDGADGTPRWIVRAFLPHASEVQVLFGDLKVRMEKRHTHGLFVAYFDREPRDYRLKLVLWNGDVETIDDPYRFPPLLSDF